MNTALRAERNLGRNNLAVLFDGTYLNLEMLHSWLSTPSSERLILLYIAGRLYSCISPCLDGLPQCSRQSQLREGNRALMKSPERSEMLS